MMRTAKMYLMEVCIAALVGCSSMGVPTPQSFDEKLAAAKITATAAMDEIDVLVVNHKISAADAKKSVDSIDASNAAINAAATLHSTDPAGAESKLALTLTALQTLQAFLHTKATPQ